MHTQPIILIVDDQPQNLKALGNLLSTHDYRISFAQSGEKALETLKTLEPDLILLDIQMEGIDGYETCERIREQESLHDVPILFLTAKAESADIVQAFKVGGVDYITKPFRTQELLARVATHLKLRSTTRALQIANEAKSELLGIAAHDLKNPLSVILGMTEMLIESEKESKRYPMTSAERLDMLDGIFKSSENMLTVIKELLNVESITTGTVKLNLQPALLYDILTEILALNAAPARTKKITLHNRIPDDLIVNVDVPRIREVFDNLVSNAVKYSPQNKSVYIETEARGDFLCVKIRDEGPGLTEEDKAKAFRRFQKLSARPTAGEHSSGLGLSIVKNLVELHGGEVGVDSVHGQGATFYVTLPQISEETL